MKTSFHSAFAAAALLLSPGALYAVDQFTVQDLKNDRELQQELNGSPGFGPLERSTEGALIQGNRALPQGSKILPNGTILGDDGSERLLENADRFSIQSGVKPTPESLPPGGESKPGSNLNEAPAFPPNAAEDFQD